MKLTVVITDISPAIHMGMTPSRRVVQFDLTEEQVAKISLRKTGHYQGKDTFEEIENTIMETQS